MLLKDVPAQSPQPSIYMSTQMAAVVSHVAADSVIGFVLPCARLHGLQVYPTPHTVACPAADNSARSPGHSMGGGLAAEAAGANPALVRAAVLLDPVNYALASANVPWTGLIPQALLTRLARCLLAHISSRLWLHDVSSGVACQARHMVGRPWQWLSVATPRAHGRPRG